ncbi:hypothetical protein [Leptolyngbya sp. GGD]|uniref:hypothetical protein n=1 Tax=Leptolyngbya sp. GGD TaxID=2997907 RepID=UPI00227C2B9B|nr:hypothetical protein [Leptolyngbya sp. GGD]MCY6494265.1 hypothetical protein [Leptolyngbya sp. GGD]
MLEEPYVSPGYDDDKADQYEPMWYVLQQLPTPELDIPVNATSVRGHLRVLKALKNTL